MITTSVAGRTWHFSHTLGRQTGEVNESPFGKTGGYCYPVDVAAAGNGILFVLSRGWGYHRTINGMTDIWMRIGKTTIDEEHIGDFARGDFIWPVGIAVAGDGNVYCSDEYENRITFFDPDAVLPYPEHNPDGDGLGRWGESGPDEGQLNGPSGLAFDDEDHLYVVDSLSDRVQKFTKDGEFILGWGTTGTGGGEFNRPWGVTVDGEGGVYVADWGNHRVQKFSPEGNYLMSFGTVPGQGGDLDHPAGVAVDSEGDVYVTDWGNRRVQIFEPNGEVLTALYGDASKLSKALEYNLNRDADSIKLLNANADVMPHLARFGRPVGIAVDEKDRIIITDAIGRLQVYIKDKDYVEPTA